MIPLSKCRLVIWVAQILPLVVFFLHCLAIIGAGILELHQYRNKKLGDHMYRKNIAIFIGALIISIKISGCSNMEKPKAMPTQENITGVWISFYQGKDNSNKSKSILIFRENYYTKILQDSKYNMIFPKEKHKYVTYKKDGNLLVILLIYPQLPPYKVFNKENQLVMVQKWEGDKAECYYKKITEAEADKVLNKWKISDITFNKLEYSPLTAEQLKWVTPK